MPTRDLDDHTFICAMKALTKLGILFPPCAIPCSVFLFRISPTAVVSIRCTQAGQVGVPLARSIPASRNHLHACAQRDFGGEGVAERPNEIPQLLPLTRGLIGEHSLRLRHSRRRRPLTSMIYYWIGSLETERFTLSLSSYTRPTSSSSVL